MEKSPENRAILTPTPPETSIMSITVANPIEGLDPDLEDSFTEEGEDEYTMREAMDQVYQLRDCIMTVPTDQVETLKQGLIARKGKDNAKLKKAEVAVGSDVLSFLVTPHTRDGVPVPGLSDVRIKLAPKKSVTIKEIRVPSDEF